MRTIRNIISGLDMVETRKRRAMLYWETFDTLWSANFNAWN